jgi:hypothetical protein
MKKLMYVLSLLILTVSFNLKAQITVNVGDNLVQAIMNAPDGSEIIVMPGIHKANYREIPIDKSLNIHGQTGQPKPVVYIQELGLSGSDINVTLEGIEFSGATLDSLTSIEDTITLSGDYLLNLTDSFKTAGNLTIRNCVVRNLTRSVIRGDRVVSTVNSITIDDCIIFDLRGGSSYGPFRLKSKINFGEFSLTNSTLHHIQGTLIDCKDMVSYPANILLDHCTLYKWGGVIDSKYLFEITANDQASLVIKNSILAKTNDTEAITTYGFRILADAYCEMGFCVMTSDFIVDDSTYSGVIWDKTEFNSVDYEVNFVYPDTSNFSIPLGDDLYEMSEEGTLVGDPRWSMIPPEGLDAVLGTNQFSVYPNPANGQLLIMNAGSGKLELLNALGVRVNAFDLYNSSVYPIDISGYEPGIYFVRLNGTVTQKIIIQ